MKTKTIILQRYWFDVEIDITNKSDSEIKKLVEKTRRTIDFARPIPVEVMDDTVILQSERVLRTRYVELTNSEYEDRIRSIWKK